jgi:hypothetical protein
LNGLELVGPADPAESEPLPPLGSSIQVSSQVKVTTKIAPAPGAPPETTARSTGDSSICTAARHDLYDTEFTSLELTGDIPSAGGRIPYIIRESPTLASTGEHSVLPLPGPGTFQVDSFFDVFTELSLDGGQTFYAASGPIHLELTGFVPEPGSVALAAIGLGGGALIIRRQQPRWRRAS